MTVKNNRAPLLSNIKLYASFHHHMWIQTGVTVRKRSSWVVTSVTLTFDLWPWSFAWTLPWSVVTTPENFMMIRWWEHSQKGVTDRQTDGQTDRQTENTIHRAAWSQLKMDKFGPIWPFVLGSNCSGLNLEVVSGNLKNSFLWSNWKQCCKIDENRIFNLFWSYLGWKRTPKIVTGFMYI